MEVSHAGIMSGCSLKSLGHNLTKSFTFEKQIKYVGNPSKEHDFQNYIRLFIKL